MVRALQQATGRMVCAIGDGGNDVSMIQAADVGAERASEWARPWEARLAKKKKGPQLCRARLPYAISSRGSWLGLEYVGVGIVGKEGRQASLAADCSVPPFSPIVRLLCTCCSTCVWGWERDRP